MNDKVIELLAQKLGTTVEFLWAVLLKQAPIYAISNTVQLCVYLCAFALWVRYLLKNVGNYGFIDDVMPILVVITSFVGFALAIYVFLEPPMILTAIFNPEFWALKQIIK